MAKQAFPLSLWDKDSVILAMPTGMRQALIGVCHGCSFGGLSSSHRGRTLLRDRSKLCSSHWSNQWLTSNTELMGEVNTKCLLQAQVPEVLPPGPVRIIVLSPEAEDMGEAWMHGIAREW